LKKSTQENFMKTRRGGILAVLILAALLPGMMPTGRVRAATVTGTIVNTGGTPLVTNVVFAPLSTPQAAGTDTVPSTVGAVTTGADGGFSIALNAGDYKVTVGGAARDSFIIAVPSGNGVYALNSLITSALSYGSSVAPAYELKSSKGQTNGYAALNTNALVPAAQLGAGTAGTNTFLRGDGVWVANSSGNYVAAGTNTSAQTNSNVVTVNADVSIALVNSLSSALSGKMDKSANLGDVASPSAARATIGGMRFNGDTASIGNGNFFLPDFTGISGDAVGQPYMSRYGQLWHWDGAKWNSGLQLADALYMFSTNGEAQIMVGDPGNTIDNALMLQNTNSQHFSAMRFKDRFGSEVGAFGYGNDAASIYRTNLYWERFDGRTAMGFAGNLAGGGRGLYGGVTEQNNDLIWYNNNGFPSASPTLRLQAASGDLTNSGNFTAGGLIYAGTGRNQITVPSGKLNPSALDSTGNGTVNNLTVARLFFTTKGTAAAPLIDLSATGTALSSDSGFNFVALSKGTPFFYYLDNTRNGAFTNSSIGFCSKASSSISVLSTLDVNGSMGGGAMVSKSASYTLTTDDFMVEVTATGTTQTLPDATACLRREYLVKLTASGSCTVNTTSSQTIDGATTYSLSAQYKYLRVKSNGVNWLVIGNN
jgi:hypothetical protein